jgi:hypothetical protein
MTLSCFLSADESRVRKNVGTPSCSARDDSPSGQLCSLSSLRFQRTCWNLTCCSPCSFAHLTRASLSHARRRAACACGLPSSCQSQRIPASDREHEQPQRNAPQPLPLLLSFQSIPLILHPQLLLPLLLPDLPQRVHHSLVPRERLENR